MTTTALENPAQFVAENEFLQEVVRQIRAYDSYGFYRSWSDELVLSPFVVSKKKKREISTEGDIDPATKLRILCFYRGIASLIEKETGQLCQVIVDLNHEGFGWALVWSGRLLSVSRTLRDAHRFGFESLEKLAEEGEKLSKAGIELSQRFPEVARL
ncbi:nitrogen fixation protein [Rippkaea orientalis PCC 8801]|uniref:Cyanothece PCC 8801 NifK (nifK) n=1 Tax=Rippkaea orientalis (strain PCC 8801 / RF-1) TaxID=41431 RepID=O07358_RIPO1|nr:NifX-associated nitrogen fixation protein [Rippkaea orientalis]AAC35200.1 ORF2 [Rippkaea orientalis PCC 8801]ACK65837.1 nitrogen fixation protein [Rippkaea orientalis PCC 8801]